MKLLICVVNEDDTNGLVDGLEGEGYRATIVSTTGGFLREGNATLLIGVPDEDVPAVVQIVQSNCPTRLAYANPLPSLGEPATLRAPTPIQIRIGGAIVFVLDVERFVRY